MLPILGIVLVPGILWGWVFYNFQRYKKVNIFLLLILFIGGAGSGFLSLVLNHSIEKYTIFWSDSAGSYFNFFGKEISLVNSFFWLIVGMNEEFSKFLVLLLLIFHSRHLEEPFDGILFAVVVSLGFAIMENFYYLERYGIAVIIIRTLITVPAHAFMSVPMGYFVAKSRLALIGQNEGEIRFLNSLILLFGGWFISSFLHGLYDLLLSLNMESEAYIQILIMGLISFWLSKHSLDITWRKIK